MGSSKLYRSLKKTILNVEVTFITKVGAIPDFGASGSQGIGFKSSTSQNITINWGDGTSNTYAMAAGVIFIAPLHTYVAPYGNGVAKTVTVKFDNAADITEILFSSVGVDGPSPSGIQELINLQKFQFTNANGSLSRDKVTTFPAAVLNLQFLTEFVIRSNFTSTFDAKIPIEIFNKPLTNLGYIEGLKTSDGYEATNINKIYLLAGTLQRLSLGHNLNRTLFTALPDDPVFGFQNLVNLIELSCDASATWSSPPPVINQIPTLQRLGLSYNQLNGWGDLSNLVNLNYFMLEGTPTLPDFVPPYFASLVNLKTMFMNGNFLTIARLDNMVNSIYAAVQMYATGSSSIGNFRQMRVSIATGGVASPSGVYAAPVGFRKMLTPRDIHGITQANPGVLTTNSLNGIVAGDIVYLKEIQGMTELNHNLYKVGTVVGQTFQLLNLDGTNVDTTAFGAYVAGGKVHVDGNPATAKEKMYVLTENYAHIFTYS